MPIGVRLRPEHGRQRRGRELGGQGRSMAGAADLLTGAGAEGSPTLTANLHTPSPSNPHMRSEGRAARRPDSGPGARGPGGHPAAAQRRHRVLDLVFAVGPSTGGY